ncbi:MAG: hypothetical protein KAH23_00610 [Kiritimatiellae bacterium]|nr:hypothetical protein [Kiritimatiellia bacterium]
MDDLKTMRFIWAVAAVAILVGVVMSISTVQAICDGSVMLKKKADNIEELRRIKKDIASYRLAKDRYDALSSKRPPPIKGILKASASGLKEEELRGSRERSVSGWTIRRYEMTFDDAEMGEVMTFVRKAESARPPWRLTKYVARASGGIPGRGRISLTMEAMEGR